MVWSFAAAGLCGLAPFNFNVAPSAGRVCNHIFTLPCHLGRETRKLQIQALNEEQAKSVVAEHGDDRFGRYGSGESAKPDSEEAAETFHPRLNIRPKLTRSERCHRKSAIPFMTCTLVSLIGIIRAESQHTEIAVDS